MLTQAGGSVVRCRAVVWAGLFWMCVCLYSKSVSVFCILFQTFFFLQGSFFNRLLHLKTDFLNATRWRKEDFLMGIRVRSGILVPCREIRLVSCSGAPAGGTLLMDCVQHGEMMLFRHHQGERRDTGKCTRISIYTPIFININIFV